jgi:hypothetical protein
MSANNSLRYHIHATLTNRRCDESAFIGARRVERLVERLTRHRVGVRSRLEHSVGSRPRHQMLSTSDRGSNASSIAIDATPMRPLSQLHRSYALTTCVIVDLAKIGTVIYEHSRLESMLFAPLFIFRSAFGVDAFRAVVHISSRSRNVAPETTALFEEVEPTWNALSRRRNSEPLALH